VSLELEAAAIVLRAVDYGEADRVVTLLTRGQGKLSAFARSAKRSVRRFGGALEPFTLARARLRERRGGDLWGLESMAVDRPFPGIRGDLARIACAAHACEVARALVRDAEPHPALFDLLVGYLDRLDRGPAEPTTLRAAELGILAEAGLAPRLDACARCGEPLPDAAALRLDPAEGGLLCGACGPASPGAPLLRAAAVAALAGLQRGGLDAPPIPKADAPAIRDALDAFVEHHAGHRLASRKFLDEVGPMLG
jgi:DNA repair protein RecO (recombination protein O)